MRQKLGEFKVLISKILKLLMELIAYPKIHEFMTVLLLHF